MAVVWIILSLVSSRLAWRAVFLESGQVYFGRFTYVPFSSTVTLHDAHYLKPGSDQADASGVPNLTILPVSGDVHGPVSTMTITKSHILYYQGLRKGTVLYKGLEAGLGR